MNLILLCFQQLWWNFENFERLYLKTSIKALEYFFHYSLQMLIGQTSFMMITMIL